MGPIPLTVFFRQVNYDLLATNLIEDESVVDRIQFYPSKVIFDNISNFDLIEMTKQVVEVEGHRIGLIGYITDLTPSITSADLPNLTFQDVSPTVPDSYILNA